MIIISKILGSVKKWICPHCDNIQPLPKLEFIRHMTMWHEDVLVKEFEAPDLPVVQRELQKRWADPHRCKYAAELGHRRPQWEVWAESWRWPKVQR